MRRVPVLLAVLALLLITTAPAAANNDPHRIFVPADPVNLGAEYCGFAVRMDFPVNREYETASTLADGSLVERVTGSFFATVTNVGTGKSITVTASGPGSFTTSADGNTFIWAFTGQTLWYYPGLISFGLPSNIVHMAGPGVATFDNVTGDLLQLTGHPHVLTDICAAIR
jgi:hypothetical protein